MWRPREVVLMVGATDGVGSALELHSCPRHCLRALLRHRRRLAGCIRADTAQQSRIPVAEMYYTHAVSAGERMGTQQLVQLPTVTASMSRQSWPSPGKRTKVCL
jgi:hypothetical protein